MKQMTVADIAKLIHGEVVGDGSFIVRGVNGFQEAGEGDVTFAARGKYEALLETTKAKVVICAKKLPVSGKILVVVDDPSFAFTTLLKHVLPDQSQCYPKGIHPTAVIDPRAMIGPDVAIGPFVIVEANASIGAGTVIFGQSYVGHGSQIGQGCLIYPQVMVREGIIIKDRVIIHSGSVVGSDGYGYVTVNGKHEKIPQIGTVIVESDVEIGANVTIDRARFDKTVIGEGTKIDNLVHVAHNVTIGKHCLIVAQAGISGSTRLGNYVILAGQVGVVGHITIGDGAIVTAQSGVSKSVKPGEQVFGSPAKPIREAFKVNAHIQRLEHYAATIKELKQRLEALEKKIS